MLARPVFATFLAAFVATTGAASAEPPGAVFSSYDLVGTWASACNQPPSPTNWFVIHSATADGGMETRYDNGAGGSLLLSIVDSAQPLTATTLGMSVRYADARWGTTDGAIYEMIVEVAARRVHTVQSIRNDGTILIKDSKFATDGRPSQILYKCSGGTNA